MACNGCRPIQWILSSPTDRTPEVAYNGSLSAVLLEMFGVPQGSGRYWDRWSTSCTRLNRDASSAQVAPICWWLSNLHQCTSRRRPHQSSCREIQSLSRWGQRLAGGQQATSTTQPVKDGSSLAGFQSAAAVCRYCFIILSAPVKIADTTCLDRVGQIKGGHCTFLLVRNKCLHQILWVLSRVICIKEQLTMC